MYIYKNVALNDFGYPVKQKLHFFHRNKTFINKKKQTKTQKKNQQKRGKRPNE